MAKLDKTCVKKLKIKVKKNSVKISIWKFIDQCDLDHCSLINHRKISTIPNLTGFYFKSKKAAIEWKEKLAKEGKMWDCRLFKINMYFKESK